MSSLYEPAQIKSERTLREIELVPAPNIFNSNENSLKYEMIDAAKARNIVKALKDLKSKFMNQTGGQFDVLSNEQRILLSDHSSYNDGAVGYLEGSKLSVNLMNYQKSIEPLSTKQKLDKKNINQIDKIIS